METTDFAFKILQRCIIIENVIIYFYIFNDTFMPGKPKEKKEKFISRSRLLEPESRMC